MELLNQRDCVLLRFLLDKRAGLILVLLPAGCLRVPVQKERICLERGERVCISQDQIPLSVAQSPKLQWFKQNRNVFLCHLIEVQSQKVDGFPSVENKLRDEKKKKETCYVGDSVCHTIVLLKIERLCYMPKIFLSSKGWGEILFVCI